MGLISRLLGSDENIKEGIKGLYHGIDAAIYTDEEKAETNTKILEWKLRWLQATAPQNVSRRFIAVIVTSLWGCLVFLSVLLNTFGLEKESDFIFKVLDEVVGQPFMLIMGFYFLAHVVRGYNKKPR